MSESNTIFAPTIARNATVEYANGFRLTGDLVFDPGQDALWLDSEEGQDIYSVNLVREGYLAEIGNVFVKDWSECEGVADSLVAQGFAEKVRRVSFGPFRASAVELRMMLPEIIDIGDAE